MYFRQRIRNKISQKEYGKIRKWNCTEKW